MKVLLIKDVYNLGRAGEVKKVADGYARNFLFPQKMAVYATKGALNQIQKIESAAAKQRELLNEEMKGLSEQIAGLELAFTAKVGETGKLYGSITQQQIIDAVNEQLHVNLDRHQVESQPLRQTGEHDVRIRLTYDLVPEVKVLVESEEEEAVVEMEEEVEEAAAEMEDEVEETAAEMEEDVEETAEEMEDSVEEDADSDIEEEQADA